MRTWTVLVALVGVSGCMVNPGYLPENYSATRLNDGRLSISVAPGKYTQLGGQGSDQLKAFVLSVVAKEGVCSNGFTTTDPIPVRGYVSIVVSCISKGT
jgi:hypothetical protein